MITDGNIMENDANMMGNAEQVMKHDEPWWKNGCGAWRFNQETRGLMVKLEVLMRVQSWNMDVLIGM